MQAVRSNKNPLWRLVIGALTVGGLVLSGGGTAMAKATAGKKKSDAPQVIQGTVKAIDKDSLTVEAKKGGSRVFNLNGDTTYKIKGKKGAADETGTRTDIKDGERVAVTAKGDQAQTVLIEPKAKKEKKKNA